jgi:hypothetical protein
VPNVPERPRRVIPENDGPVPVEGAVAIVGDDGVEVVSERCLVAVRTCRRSRSLPWCDISHRAKSRPCPAPDHGRATDHTHEDRTG